MQRLRAEGRGFDPHRPYQDFHKANELSSLRCSNHYVCGEKHSVYTDAQGTYLLRLPQPRPKTIHVLFRKEGYEAEPVLHVLTSESFDTNMAKLP